jgi:hypothetical protein
MRLPRDTDVHREGLVQCRERLGGSCAITINESACEQEIAENACHAVVPNQALG